jgi:RNA polymerase sigma-70 factor (ECF subfamily)
MDPMARPIDAVEPSAPERPKASEPSALGPTAALVDHFFRHESGRLVAVLVRVFGLRHLELVEDMVQSALVDALQVWRIRGVPENPSAWMHRVTRNKVVDALRRRDSLLRLAPDLARLRPLFSSSQCDDLFLDSEIEDSQLRLIFACCHPALSRENQVALTLKSLCGFSNAEIARGLLVTEENIKKRLQRARQHLADQAVEFEVPRAEELSNRLDAVHRCLYLLFNEGYAATTGDAAIRFDLCEEAARLCHLLCEQPRCRSSATFALLALMLFHAARFDARTDDEGRLLLLEDQDRSLWDHRLIAQARYFLDQSATGRSISTYHFEAGIALLHCSAPSFDQTDWRSILEHYDVLLRLQPSPIYQLNRAIALAHLEGPKAGIDLLTANAADPVYRHYYLFDAAIGELYRRAGNFELALEHLNRARDRTQSGFEQALLDRRIAGCQGQE